MTTSSPEPSPAVPPDVVPATPPTVFEWASWIATVLALVVVLLLHLLPALLSGLLVYAIVHMLTPVLQRKLTGPRARLVAVAAIAVLVAGFLTAAVVGLAGYLRGEGRLAEVVQRVAQVIDQARAILPASIAESLPSDADDVKAFVVATLRSHAEAIRAAGTHFGLGFVQVLIGFVIGALVSLTRARPRQYDRPLAHALVQRARRLNHAFRSIVFAQIRISAVNAVLTALFLLVGLRLFGLRLPLAKTLVVVTFVVGLIPVLGNLISNTIIVVVAASVSLGAAIASLVFLVVIHKLEYFLNARIVGAEIRAAAWELLIAMLVMEAAFGIPGIVAAPIYYAWLKDELKARQLI